jgi:SAM-dependent methyltransferase
MPNLPKEHLEMLRQLEQSYLESNDPIRQSGFGGGAQRWRLEREPILDAIDVDGDILDVGCANGYLLECLVNWGRERNLVLTPYGVDIGAELINMARQRFPELQHHFFIANAWDWIPSRRFRYVYALWDSVPLEYLEAFVRHLLSVMVVPQGRLILGAYGSRSRQIEPLDLTKTLTARGFTIVGSAQAGEPVNSRFVWIDN